MSEDDQSADSEQSTGEINLSIDPSLINIDSESEVPIDLGDGNPEQFKTNYPPARKFCAKYVVSPDRSDATARTYDSKLRMYVDFLQESQGVAPDEASKSLILGYFSFLGKQYGRPKSTLGGIRSVIKTFHEFLQLHEKLPDPEVTAAEVGNLPVKEYAAGEHTYRRSHISREEVEKLFNNASRPRNELLGKTLYNTGARNKSVATIKLGDIDYNSLKIELYDYKNTQSLTAPITERLALEIKYFCKTKRREYSGWDEHNYLFISSNGGHLATNSITEIIKTMATRAGIQEQIGTTKTTPNQPDSFGDSRVIYRVTPHTLRHSIVTHLSNKNIPKDIQKVLTGHSSDAIEDYDHSQNLTAWDIIRKNID